MKVVRPKALAEELGRPGPSGAEVGSPAPGPAALRQMLSEEDRSMNASIYVILRAVDRFHAMTGRWVRKRVAAWRSPCMGDPQ